MLYTKGVKKPAAVWLAFDEDDCHTLQPSGDDDNDDQVGVRNKDTETSHKKWLRLVIRIS